MAVTPKPVEIPAPNPGPVVIIVSGKGATVVGGPGTKVVTR